MRCAILVASLLLAATAHAQQSDLEPGVQTSSAAAPAHAGPSESRPEAAPKPAAGDETHAARPAAAPASPPAAPRTAASSAAPSGAQHGASGDRLQLETTEISGNRELPRVMYVVPWRKDDLAQYAGRPPNSLLDEALRPIDRDVFRREAQYYDALKAGAASANSQPHAQAAAPVQPAPKDEK